MPATKGHRGWGAIRKLPSGKYQASFLGKDLQRHTALGTFDTKLNAEGWLANEKGYLDRCRMTGEVWKTPKLRAEEQKATVLLLADYGKRWIDQRPVRITTKTEYLSIWKNHIEPKLGPIALRDLSAEAVRAWYAGLGSDKPGRRKNAYSLLHGILKTAVNDQLIERNPCMITGAMTISRASEPDILTPKELTTIVDAMPDRLQALVLLCVWCGLRWSEVTELRRGDFNADYTGFAITRHATHKGGCSIGKTKSGKVRTALIPEAIRTPIKAHLDEYVDADRDALVFAPVRGGCHVNDQVFNTHFKLALGKVNRESAHIHDLRHSGATSFSHVGASPTEIQKFLGHSTPLMAMRYAAATDERRVELTDRLSKLAESPSGVSDSST